MTVLAKHGEDDWRLYHDDGTQIDTSTASQLNTSAIANMVNTEYPGDSMLATDSARKAYTDIVTNNVYFVDVTDGEILPWNRTG